MASNRPDVRDDVPGYRAYVPEDTEGVKTEDILGENIVITRHGDRVIQTDNGQACRVDFFYPDEPENREHFLTSHGNALCEQIREELSRGGPFLCTIQERESRRGGRKYRILGAPNDPDMQPEKGGKGGA